MPGTYFPPAAPRPITRRGATRAPGRHGNTPCGRVANSGIPKSARNAARATKRQCAARAQKVAFAYQSASKRCQEPVPASRRHAGSVHSEAAPGAASLRDSYVASGTLCGRDRICRERCRTCTSPGFSNARRDGSRAAGHLAMSRCSVSRKSPSGKRPAGMGTKCCFAYIPSNCS